MYRRPRRPVAIVLILLFASGCSTTMWEPTTLPPAELIERQSPRRIRATTEEGTEVELVYPHIRRDTLFAGSPPDCRRDPYGQPVCELPVVTPETERVGLGDIAGIEVAETRLTGTGAAVWFFGGLAALYLLLRLSCDDDCFGWDLGWGSSGNLGP